MTTGLRLSMLEKRVFNDGERLIPGRTHDRAELVRHRSSYLFFRRVIEHDIVTRVAGGPGRALRIFDIGCGVGHGSRVLAEIAGVEVVGVDNSPDAVEYARRHYAAENITYVVADATQVLGELDRADYVVTRHMLEHVAGGVAAALRSRWQFRLMLNVPFRERAGNQHHHETGIDRSWFPEDERTEVFYEDASGVTHASDLAPALNSIICAMRRPELPPVADVIHFPVAAWRPDPLEDLGLRDIDQLQRGGLLQRARARVGRLLGRS